MSQAMYRFIVGALLLFFLVLDLKLGILFIISFISIEVLFDRLAPNVVNKIRGLEIDRSFAQNKDYKFNYDTERVFRLCIVFFVLLGTYFLPNQFWFMPWFIALMLFMSGITNVCPMALFLKWMGFR